jgi:hypothetical protein
MYCISSASERKHEIACTSWSSWINKRYYKSRVTRIKKKYDGRGNSDYPNHRSWKKMVKERKKNACVAVKRGVRVRRNCNVFNLAMENVLKGLPDKIRDQLLCTYVLHFVCFGEETWNCMHFLVILSENFVSWCQTLKNSSASFLCIQEISIGN